MLNIQTNAPEFTLPDQDGVKHSLLENRGHYTLIYFYPKDNTPGCTKEACTIAEMYDDFSSNGVKVFGINSNSIASHKKFKEKYKLPFTLLSDPKKNVIKAYKANGPLSTRRISYLIDGEGVIVKAYSKVTPSEHGGEILADVYGLKQKDGGKAEY